ncbi:MAG TPA: protein kinase [Blastocatellia bacterium]|nr:protein kinase [Blastocatellia bacterium]
MDRLLPANCTLSHYRIISRIGAGGMGEVYLAEDTRLGRKVALKLLLSDFTTNPDRLRRFELEARAAATLSHPNIAHIYEIGESDGTHYIAMEFVEGETLTAKFRREPIGLLLKHLSQVAEGLSKAHSAGIVHRDLKPDNIMITRDCYAKILDFGLAKLIEAQSSSITSEDAATAVMAQQPLSVAGTVMGTVGYMSPEQAQGKSVDQRADIFSFGCILYEAATGNRAFEGDSAIDTLHKIIYSTPTPVTDLNPGLPADLQRIIRRCLAKEPDKRYQTIRDVVNDLEDLRREVNFDSEIGRSIPPQTVSAPGTPVSQATSSQRFTGTSDVQTPSMSSAEYLIGKVKSHRLGATLISAAILVVLAAGGYLAFSERRQSTSIESIAVMPFVNAGGAADVEYLSDGMTESLISSLSQLPKLTVKARSSVFRYKGKETSPQTIGKELNVQAILNGRVVQLGDQLTLSLELIEARTENVIWGEQYNRKRTDLVTLQSEIARDVSSKLRTKLSGADEQRLAKTYTANPEAYQHYLQGRFYWNRRTAQNIKRAIEEFKAASDKDPTFALAYAGLADCYVVSPVYTSQRSSETLPQARINASRAVELDASLAEPHASLGMTNWFDWRINEAESEFKRAIELNPKYPTAHHWYSRVLRVLGRSDEAWAEIKKAEELDPMSLVIINNVAEQYVERGDLTSAEKECRRLIDLDPNFWSAHQTLSIVLVKQNRNTEALVEAQKSIELSNRSNASLAFLGHVYGRLGQKNEAQSVIKELEDRHAKEQADGRDLAVAYSGLGDKDHAFAWLEKAFQYHSSSLSALRLEPALDSLRDDPRWDDLQRRVRASS